jgi:hypothetical protein
VVLVARCVVYSSRWIVPLAHRVSVGHESGAARIEWFDFGASSGDRNSDAVSDSALQGGPK